MQNAPFTIKQVSDHGGVSYYPAKSINAIPGDVPARPGSVSGRDRPPRGVARPPRKIEFDMGDGTDVRASIDTGVVYILNQNGKTIDTLVFPIEHDTDCAVKNEPVGPCNCSMAI